MKKIYILTLFPEFFSNFLDSSIIKRALSKNVVDISIVNIREFSKDKNHRVDAPPIGGGAGLIQQCQPIVDALRSLDLSNARVVLTSPLGKTYSSVVAHEYKDDKKDLVIICGHYEGVDDRLSYYIDEYISLGDFILTGGEIPALAIVDSVTRLLDGAINSDSIIEESFEDGLLEYPQYAEPYDFEGHKVPDILYSGNHEAIKKWRRKQSLLLTKKYRKDLFDKVSLTSLDHSLLKEEEEGKTPSWEEKALQKGHKFIK